MFNTTLYKIKTHELSLVRKLSPNGAITKVIRNS